jgi:pimeloyl-ACP methyl ester carboxylesterase
MRTYVLVHGGWVGGWTWRDFAPLLRSKGHEVYTPTLTGQGERAHLYRPEVGLHTHTQDIVNVLEYEDLHDIVLVGHSYGGMVVTAVADRLPDRIAHLVYLDAMLPNGGQSVADLGVIEGFGLLPAEDGRYHPFSPPPGDQDELKRRERWVLQPPQTAFEHLALDVPTEERSFSLTYVRAANFPTPVFDAFKPRLQGSPRWRYLEWPCGHSIHREMPHELAELLLEMA